jgi:hypothetical protein
MTVKQQTPIKSETGGEIRLDLGSEYAKKLGLAHLAEWDGSAEVVAEPAADNTNNNAEDGEGKAGGKKKKNKKKKKKVRSQNNGLSCFASHNNDTLTNENSFCSTVTAASQKKYSNASQHLRQGH